MSDALKDLLLDHAATIIRTSEKDRIHTLVVLLDNQALEQIRQIVREEVERAKYTR